MNRSDFLKAIPGLGLVAAAAVKAEPAKSAVYETVDRRDSVFQYLSDVIERESGLRPVSAKIEKLDTVNGVDRHMIVAVVGGVVFRKTSMVSGLVNRITTKKEHADDVAYQLAKRAREMGMDVSHCFKTGPWWERIGKHRG